MEHVEKKLFIEPGIQSVIPRPKHINPRWQAIFNAENFLNYLSQEDFSKYNVVRGPGERGYEFTALEYQGFKGNINLTRFFSFIEKGVENITCKENHLDLKNKLIVLEVNPSDQSLFFNLYVRQNQLIKTNRTQITYREITIDHIVPFSFGGNNKPINLDPCCDLCNHQRKHSVPFEKLEAFKSDLELLKKYLRNNYDPQKVISCMEVYKETPPLNMKEVRHTLKFKA
jgi:hypothetical protein